MTTAERMKFRRKELGLSAEYVADKLGCSPATIYRYEKGDIEKMPLDILVPLASILQTTPVYLMGLIPEWDSDIYEDYESANDDTRVLIFQKYGVPVDMESEAIRLNFIKKPSATNSEGLQVPYYNELSDENKAKAKEYIEMLLRLQQNQ